MVGAGRGRGGERDRQTETIDLTSTYHTTHSSKSTTTRNSVVAKAVMQNSSLISFVYPRYCIHDYKEDVQETI